MTSTFCGSCGTELIEVTTICSTCKLIKETSSDDCYQWYDFHYTPSQSSYCQVNTITN